MAGRLSGWSTEVISMMAVAPPARGADALNVLVPALARALGAANGDASAQKAVLEAIGAIASRADSFFGPHYATLMPLLAQALQGTQASQSEEVAQMRARAIECAAAIGAAVPSQFRNAAPAVLPALLADASVPPPPAALPPSGANAMPPLSTPGPSDRE